MDFVTKNTSKNKRETIQINIKMLSWQIEQNEGNEEYLEIKYSIKYICFEVKVMKEGNLLFREIKAKQQIKYEEIECSNAYDKKIWME